MENIAKKNKKYYLRCMLCFAVMLVFPLMSPIGQITRQGMAILGIYIGTALLWAFVDMIWPSLLGIILVSLTGYMSFNEYIAAGFSDTTVIFVFMISIFAFFINESGVSDSIARYIVSLKIAKGKPWLTSSLFVMAAYIIACLISSVAAVLVVLEFFSQFARKSGYKKGDKYPVLMMVCITFAAHMGGSVWTFRTPDSILVGYIRQQGGDVPLIPYFLCSVFIGGGAVILYLLYCKMFAKVDISLISSCELVEKLPMTRYQKQLLACSLVLLLLLILENMLSGETVLGAMLKGISTNGIVVIILTVMAFFRLKDRNMPFVDLEKGTRAIPWKIFYIIIFNMPMAAIMNDSSLGISATISTGINQIFGSNINTNLFIFLMTCLIVLATTFLANVPVCLIFYNVVSLFAPALGISTTVLACIISLTSNASVILPNSNPQAAMLHSRKDWVDTKDIIPYGIIQSSAVIITVSVAYMLFLRKVL